MSARRQSITNSAKKVYVDKGNIGEVASLHVENMANAKQITAEDLDEVIMSRITFTDDNEERLDLLESLKEPYLFMSDDLLKIVEITPSLKTRKEMISMIGPRLIDPNAKVSDFTGMFRFSEDKQFVEEILKARMSAINAAKFTKTVGGNLLAAGRGGRGGGVGGRGGLAMTGRGGRGASGAASVGGRGSGKHTSGRPSSTPVTLERTRSPKASPLATPKSLKISTKPVWEEKQKNPEICPEDTTAGVVNASPVSMGGGETDSETVGSLSSMVEARQGGATLQLMSPVPEVVLAIDTPVVLAAAPSVAVSAAGAGVSAEGAVGALPQRSLFSDITDTSSASPTPIEAPCATTNADAAAVTAPSSAVGLSSTPATDSAVLTLPSSSFFPAVECSIRSSTNASPVPGIIIEARAPQRGPPIPTSRRVHSQPAHHQQNLSLGSQPTSSAPSTSFSPFATPSITPSTSTANLVSLSGPGARSSGPSPVPTHSSVTVVPDVKISVARESVKEYIDLAPMVSDCPQIGIKGLLSKFSGKGGTGTSNRPTGSSSCSTSSQPTSPKSGVVDYTPAKARRTGELVNTFKSATSTASSTYNYPARGSSGGGGGAPAPVDTGAPKTFSIAERMAAFNRAAKGGSPGFVRKQNGANTDDDLNISSTKEEHSQHGPLMRRHSESITPANPKFALALAAVNAPASTTTSAALEVAGAGGSADIAMKCAAVLRMTKAEFLALQPEPPINAAEDALTGDPMLPQFSYQEIVRRCYIKDYDYEGIKLNRLEMDKYVCEADFFLVFLRSKEEYARQLGWRQQQQKIKAMIF